MTKKSIFVIVVAVGALVVSWSLVSARSRAASPPVAVASASPNDGPTLIAGPGRVEPSSEDIKVGSELSGKLKSVKVEEGDAIWRCLLYTSPSPRD